LLLNKTNINAFHSKYINGLYPMSKCYTTYALRTELYMSNARACLIIDGFFKR